MTRYRRSCITKVLVTRIVFLVMISQASADFAVSTLAGSGASGRTDGAAISAKFNGPYGLAFDAAGNIYVADRYNHLIRMVSDGFVTTIAGNGTFGFADGPAASAMFNQPNGVAVDGSGNIFVADCFNHKIRIISTDGTVSTFAGNGTSGATDGVGANATFSYPNCLAIDASGNIYVADFYGNRIRKVTPSAVVTTIAGSSYGFADGSGVNALFKNPAAVAVDASGNVYVADSNNCRIRRITPDGMVSTFAGNSTQAYADGVGSNAMFNQPLGVAVDSSGNVYVSDSNNNMIRMISPSGNVTTIGGSFTGGTTDGAGSVAKFNHPYGLAISPAGDLYICDSYNNKLRVITGLPVLAPTITITNVPGASTTTTTIDSTNGPTYGDSPAKSGASTATTITTILAISIPITVLVVGVAALLLYMRYRGIGVTTVWHHGIPKLVVIDRS